MPSYMTDIKNLNFTTYLLEQKDEIKKNKSELDIKSLFATYLLWLCDKPEAQNVKAGYLLFQFRVLCCNFNNIRIILNGHNIDNTLTTYIEGKPVTIPRKQKNTLTFSTPATAAPANADTLLTAWTYIERELIAQDKATSKTALIVCAVITLLMAGALLATLFAPVPLTVSAIAALTESAAWLTGIAGFCTIIAAVFFGHFSSEQNHITNWAESISTEIITESALTEESDKTAVKDQTLFLLETFYDRGLGLTHTPSPVTAVTNAVDRYKIPSFTTGDPEYLPLLTKPLSFRKTHTGISIVTEESAQVIRVRAVTQQR